MNSENCGPAAVSVIKDFKGYDCRIQYCRGKYEETHFFDDMDGTLHCTECDHRVNRFPKD